jgi:CBS-domain-containing membrane protein
VRRAASCRLGRESPVELRRGTSVLSENSIRPGFEFIAPKGVKIQRRFTGRSNTISTCRRTGVTTSSGAEFQSLPTSATVADAADALIRTTQTEFPIVDGAGHLHGVLTRDTMIKALKQRGPDTPVLEVMQADIPTVSARAKLDTALRSLMQRGLPVVGVTDGEERLVGLLTVENLGEMMMVHSARPDTVTGPWRKAQR